MGTWGPVITAAAATDQRVPLLCGGPGVLQFWLGHDQRGNLKHVPSPSTFRVAIHKNQDSVSCHVDEPRDVSEKPVTKGRSTPSVHNS